MSNLQADKDVTEPLAGAMGPLAALSGLIAFLAAACCVLPMIFVTIGLGGAWLSLLDVGLIYRTDIQTISILIVAAGWVWFIVRGRRFHGFARMLAIATLLLGMSVVVWEFQGDIRGLLIEMRG